MTAPTADAAIHDLMDFAWNVVYDLLAGDCLVTGSTSESTPGSIPGWTTRPGTPSFTPGRWQCCSWTPARWTRSCSTRGLPESGSRVLTEGRSVPDTEHAR